MILKALYDYYQAMAKLGKVTSLGMEWKAIPFVIVIDEDGTFRRVIDTRDKENKQGHEYLVAKYKERQGKKSYAIAQILWDHAGYVLGIPKDDGKKEQVMASKQHEAFKLELTKLRELFPENKGFKAMELFYKKYDEKKEGAPGLCKGKVKSLPDIIPEESLLKIKKKKKVRANISFLLSTESNPNKLISSHEDIQFHQAESSEKDGEEKGRCLVTGEEGIIARKHNGISLIGAPIAKPKLISFQQSSGYDSYGKKQGLNAPISQTASDAIISGLNMLLEKDKHTNYRIGETTFVFWNTLQDDNLLKVYQEATFTGLPFDSDFDDEEEATSTSKKKAAKKRDPEKETKVVIQALLSAQGSKNAHIDREHSDRFYILALAPNAKRISVKLWMEGTVSEIVSNTLQHLEDMNITNRNGLGDELNPPLRPLKAIFKAILSIPPGKKESDISYSPHIIQSLLESIVKGLPYPVTIQNACLERIRHERSKKDAKGRRSSPVTEMRVALLKASFNRKHRNNDNIKKLTMALDPTNDTPAYLAGRLFLILEDIQKQAIGYDINSSIADRYFSRAADDPNVVFGELLGKANYHLRKLERSSGKPHFARTEIEAILDLLPQEVVSQKESQGEIKHGLDEESLFAIGYYHQRAEYRRRRAENREKKEAEKNQRSTGSGSED